MFDLITGRTEHIPATPALPLIASVTAQIVIVGGVLAASALWVTDSLPQIPTMMAFVAEVPAPPPPPPPPPPPAAPRAQQTTRPVATTRDLAPIEPPAHFDERLADDEGAVGGVPGGVEGGVPGGVVGGIVGGLPQEGAPPPPPPPAPAPRGPVRVGGNITTPELLHRVEPLYPDIAVRAHIQGVSILEATVDETGQVTDVRVLRTASALLDREAIAAVRQWRYRPLMLNGVAARFVLTVTLSFRLEQAKE